jgi:hypothetical protein
MEDMLLKIPKVPIRMSTRERERERGERRERRERRERKGELTLSVIITGLGMAL